MGEKKENKSYWTFDHALGGFFCPKCGEYMPYKNTHGIELKCEDNKYCYNCGERIYTKE